jgi:hypothetical protein
MKSARGQRVQSLRALADISWLTADQLDTLAGALTVTGHEMRSTIFSDKPTTDSAYILLSGVARITCVNRKGRRTTAIILSPGLIPAFPAAVEGITYHFRCEAVTSCQVGTIGLNAEASHFNTERAFGAGPQGAEGLSEGCRTSRTFRRTFVGRLFAKEKFTTRWLMWLANPKRQSDSFPFCMSGQIVTECNLRAEPAGGKMPGRSRHAE